MPFRQLPSLDPVITVFGACLLAETHNESLLQWINDHSIDGISTYKEGGEDRWLAVAVNKWDEETVHLHVQIARADVEDGEATREETEKLLASLLESIAVLKGEEAYCQFRASFEVSRADIPEHGVVAGLLGFKSKTSGALFSLSGASLDIEDDVFDRLTFRYDEEANAVTGELWGSGPIELSPEYFVQLYELSSTAIDCYVFERLSREHINA